MSSDLSVQFEAQAEAGSSREVTQTHQVHLSWPYDGEDVFVRWITGGPLQNRDQMRMEKRERGDVGHVSFHLTVDLPPGQHRLCFMVDGVQRVSYELPQLALDGEVHANILQVRSEDKTQQELDRLPEQTRTYFEWTSTVPSRLHKYIDIEEQHPVVGTTDGSNNALRPSDLPHQLNRLVFNYPGQSAFPNRFALPTEWQPSAIRSRQLPTPNRATLHHLAASGIKNGVLSVGSSVRFKEKYVSVIFFKPVKTS